MKKNFISETAPEFLWAQIELKKHIIINKDVDILLLHFFYVLGEKGSFHFSFVGSENSFL